MKQLNIDPAVNVGGHKFSLNDLQYLQNSVFDMTQVFAFLLGQGAQNVILTVMQLDDRTNDFDLELPLWVYYNGEVYRCDAAFAQSKTSGGAYKFRIDTATHPDNPVQYADGNSYNVHIEKTMTLVHTTLSGANYVTLASLQQFNGWQTHDPSVSNLDTSDPGDAKSLRYRVMGNTMFFTLKLKGTVSADGVISVAMPFTIQSPADQDLFGVGTLDGSIQLFSGSFANGTSAFSFATFTGTPSASDEVEFVCNGVVQIKY